MILDVHVSYAKMTATLIDIAQGNCAGPVRIRHTEINSITLSGLLRWLYRDTASRITPPDLMFDYSLDFTLEDDYILYKLKLV